VNEQWFVVRLLDCRRAYDRLRGEDLTDDQMIALGAECQAQAKEVIDYFTLAGKMYRRAE
jgi:hypothetical protein